MGMAGWRVGWRRSSFFWSFSVAQHQKKKDITEEQEPRRTPPLFLEPGDVNDSYRSSDSSPVL